MSRLSLRKELVIALLACLMTLKPALANRASIFVGFLSFWAISSNSYRWSSPSLAREREMREGYSSIVCGVTIRYRENNERCHGFSPFYANFRYLA